MAEIPKVLFITLTNVGDAILTLPVLDEIRAYLPDARITVLTGPRPAELFEDNSYVERTIIYDKHAGFSRKIGLFRMLAGERFDAVIDLRNSLLGFLLKARFKTPVFSSVPSSVKHMRERHLYKIRGLGLAMGRSKGELLHRSLVQYQKDFQFVEAALKNSGIGPEDRLILISAGARSLTKCWPRERFCELIRALHEQLKARIVLIGDRNDVETGWFISENCGSSVLDLTGRTTLRQVQAILKKSGLLITNDSANLHLASYLNVPVVAVFGPTNDEKYGPWSDNCRIVKKEIFCRPCMQAQCRYGTLECLRLVSVDQVLGQARSILAEGGGVSLQAPEQYKRILIVRTDRVGDVILSTPVIKALRDAYPSAYIAMVVRPYTRVIVDGNPYLDEVIIYDKDKEQKWWWGIWKFSRKLADKKFDLALVLNPSNRSNIIPFLAGIKRRIGYNRKLGFLLTDRIEDAKHNGEKHEIEYNLDLVRVLGIETGDASRSTFMPVLRNAEKWVEAMLGKYGILDSDKICVLNPGASDRSKIWPAERYARLAEKLAQKGMKIVILGGPQDQTVCREVIGQLRCPCIDMVANNDISQAAGLIKRASLFVSSDTGPMHIASSLRVPVIAILGRTQPGLSPLRWGPHNKESKVVHKDVGCTECLAHDCEKDFLCLQAITVDEVFEAAEELLKNC